MTVTGSLEARLDYARLLEDPGEMGAAITQLQTAVRLQPDLWAAYFELGMALGRKGDTRGAVEPLRMAAKWLGRERSGRRRSTCFRSWAIGVPDWQSATGCQPLRIAKPPPTQNVGLHAESAGPSSASHLNHTRFLLLGGMRSLATVWSRPIGKASDS